QTLEQIALEKQGVIYEKKSGTRFVLLIILGAFVGGMILNLMPCVFPVLAIKIFGFLNHASEGKGAAQRHGWLYTAGILVSFWVLAGSLMLLKSAGQGLGWGFQLQSPWFVLALAFVFILFALNLLGLFEIKFS